LPVPARSPLFPPRRTFAARRGPRAPGNATLCRLSRGEPGVERRRTTTLAIFLAAGIVAGVLAAGCAKKDGNQEVVATVNGEDIKVFELREKLDSPAGIVAVTNIPLERKKEALDRLVAGRLLAQDARSRGLDNTSQFGEMFRQNEPGARISALFRKEIEAKVRLDDDKDVKAEVARLEQAKNAATDVDALAKAKKKVAENRIRKLQEELIAAARKEAGATVDEAMIDRIGKGERVPDNAVLGSAGDGKVLYGDVKKMLRGVSQRAGPGVQWDLSKDPTVIAGVVNRELTGKALATYAKKQVPDGSDVYKSARRDLERNILMSLAADHVFAMEGTVTDKEIEASYNEHAGEMVRNGKKIPLSAVKEQIRESLQNDKRNKALDAHISELKKKARVTIDNAALSKV